MIELRELLTTRLSSIHPNVFFLKAPENVTFPYVVFEFEVIGQMDDLQLITLDIDGWDDQSDTTELETIMTKIHKDIDKQTVVIDSLTIRFYLDRKYPVIDDDPRINRRKYSYQARLYERS